jgi:hypothetical protein
VVAVGGVIIAVESFMMLKFASAFSLPWAVFYLAIGVLADIFPVIFLSYGPSKAEITVSMAINFAAACLYPPAVALLIAVGEAFIGNQVAKKGWIKSVFNMSLYAIAVGGTSFIYHYYAVATSNFLALLNLRALMLAAVYYLGSEYLLLAGLFSHITHDKFIPTISSLIRTSWLSNLALLPLGVVITVLYRQNPWMVLFLAPVLLVLYFSLKREQMLRSQTQTILEKLVDVLDSKSPETAQHSKRVRAWVNDICDEMGIQTDQKDTVLQAAVLHDLGKVGLDDSLLLKPGLSAEEFHQIMGHSAVSADLLEGLTLFQGGRDIVLHHHERYDGNGYPDHLAGENIPLGARIIAVADSFDAMVSMRAYRAKSLTVTEALKILDHERGAQFDPELVVTFTKLVHAHLEIGDMTNFPSAVQVDSMDGVSIAEGVQV